jgi:hypothetical protein
MKKLAIAEERDEDKYEHTLTLKCWLCETAGGKVISDAFQDPQARPRPPSAVFWPSHFADQSSSRWRHVFPLLRASIRS